MRTGNLLNVRVLQIALARSLITLIYHSISGTCSAAVVVFRIDVPGIIPLRLSNSLYMQHISTCIQQL